MAEEATTETESVDTGDSVEAGTEAGGDVPESQDATPERSSDDDDSSSEAFDLSDVDEKYRPHVEKLAKKYELDFKRAYTKKTQELSASQTLKDQELSNLKAQMKQFQTIAQEVIADPSKLDAYRQVYGQQLGANNAPTVNQPPPQFQTVDELTSYYQKMLDNRLSMMEQKLKQETVQTIAQQNETARWTSAIETMRSTDPRFTKYEKIIFQLAQTDPKYSSLYTGGNQREVLQSAFDDVKTLIRDDLDAVKKATLDAQKKKKGATTLTPKKTAATQGDREKPLSKEEIIARINARAS